MLTILKTHHNQCSLYLVLIIDLGFILHLVPIILSTLSLFNTYHTQHPILANAHHTRYPSYSVLIRVIYERLEADKFWEELREGIESSAGFKALNGVACHCGLGGGGVLRGDIVESGPSEQFCGDCQLG